MRRLVGLIALVLGLVFVTAVIAMTVQPVVIDMKMSGRDMSAPLRVENNGPNPLPVEIRIVDTEFTTDSVKASERITDDIIAFPPQAIIPPGETQVFRVQYVGDPASDRSRHYYATVAQLPIQLPEGQSAIQILYNFQVMINVASTTAGDAALSISNASVETSNGKTVAAFDVSNASLNYGYLSTGRLTIVQKDEGGREIFRRTLPSSEIQQTIGFGLVGPQLTRHFVSPVELPSATGPVEVTFATGRGR